MGGDPPVLPPDKDHRPQDASTPRSPRLSSEEAAAELSEGFSCAGTRLLDAPVLLFVYFHKALRAELAELRLMAVAAADIGSNGGDLVSELRRRFEFLKVAYKYHCAAEDEVVFLALDMHVQNVAGNYSLEHSFMDDLFGSVFHWLDVLADETENITNVLQEVVFCIGTIQSSICQHMLKEERQVFPLLIEKFCFEEQASLVWQFICSVPVILLEDFLPWMISFLSSEDQMEVENCLKEVVPKEESLQMVIISWLHKNSQRSFGAGTKFQKEIQSASRVEASNGHLGHFWHWNKPSCLDSYHEHKPIEGLHIWHNAIRKDLKEILEELCQIKNSTSFSHLDLMVVRLNFLADVIIFYSNALEKFFYPVLKEIAGHQSSFDKQFLIESFIESLHRLLYQHAENGKVTSNFVEKLCQELECLIMEIGKKFAAQEREVFPVISEACSQELQQHLLYMSLTVLPLGLLKCVIIWFSAHLSEDESHSILYSITQQDSSDNNRFFALLLLEWFRMGYSGKTSVESFGKELSKMFKRRLSFRLEQTKEASGSFSSHTEMELCRESNSNLAMFNKEEKERPSHLPSFEPHGNKKYNTPYTSAMNLQIFFPGKLGPLHPLSNHFGEKSCEDSFTTEFIPMDLIFFFHKALKKDLDYLVYGSAKLAEDFGFLVEFRQRFHLIQSLYHIHSDAEDEIAFPALEAKGKLQNISHSYTIDHKLEVEHFHKVSFILSEMSELDISNSSIGSKTMDKQKEKYRKLHLSLQEVCKSMHKLLSDHVQREEIELWHLFRESFSFEEQEKIIGRMLGRIRAEILQDMIPWLMESLTPEEQHAMMSVWRQATRKTMFDDWLAEWHDRYGIAKEADDSSNDSSSNPDPLEIVFKYLSEGSADEKRGVIGSQDADISQTDLVGVKDEPFLKSILADKTEADIQDENSHGCSECDKVFRGRKKNRFKEEADTKHQIDNPVEQLQTTQKPRQSKQYERLLTLSQEDLEATVRKVSNDSSLDPQKKSFIMQNLLMSRWIVSQHASNPEATINSSSREEIPGQHPSYWDPVKLILGCKHYKRNCKLLAPCCNRLFTCIRCHDEVADHSVDRKLITKMMCMECLTIQPIGLNCSSFSCNNLTMGKYYCRICKLFDGEREIYHCPYCNICRLGKGLGVDYFHCMNCNACMSRSLSKHVCREKCLEDNCPICHEYIFTSSSPVKALPCGHLMHSTCFQDYTCSHYTCPICSKSLGDMQVYFRMLDALLAEEKIPDEYSNKLQVILCNDCEKKGNAPFHWLYHKCPYCGSYNTRLL